MLNKKPGQRLAYLPEADADMIAECLVAFANGEGGLMVLGVDADGKPTEVIWEEEAEGAWRVAASRCRPPVASQWQSIDGGERELIGIEVARSPELHSLDDGRVLMRRGVENRPVIGSEVQQLASSKTSGDFEAEIVPGASRDDFDPDILAEYFTKREARGVSRTGTLDEMLFEIGAVDVDGRPTVAGILLFGKNPQAYFPQSGFVFVRFPGTKPGAENGGAGYGRRDELTGPLARIVERAWNITWEEMRVGGRITNLEREELTEYPPFAVREALINAVAHRDYKIKGRRIELRMYADRLEVISPGGLPAYITVENLVEEHYSRNPRLVNGLFQWGYIEELGLGIDRMIEDMVQAGHPPPVFKAQPYSFTVMLENNRQEPIPAKWTQSTNERQKKALSFVREDGSITNSDYQRLCPNVSSETLRRDLNDLVDRGLLLKIGSKKGTHYILK